MMSMGMMDHWDYCVLVMRWEGTFRQRDQIVSGSFEGKLNNLQNSKLSGMLTPTFGHGCKCYKWKSFGFTGLNATRHRSVLQCCEDMHRAQRPPLQVSGCRSAVRRSRKAPSAAQT